MIEFGPDFDPDFDPESDLPEPDRFIELVRLSSGIVIEVVYFDEADVPGKESEITEAKIQAFVDDLESGAILPKDF